MPIKIDAPRAWGWTYPDSSMKTQTVADTGRPLSVDSGCWCRIVREADYRKIMALVRAVEYDMDNIATGLNTSCMSTREALDRLRGKGEKKCTHTARNASTKTT